MIFLANKAIILPKFSFATRLSMLLTIFYRRGCIKSRFLRGSLRVMDWELREADVAEPSSKAELIQLKTNAGVGESVLTPAIYTNEAYSHELYPMIEYLNDRSPDGMYPGDAALRLYARTLLHRVLRKLNALWPDYIASHDPSDLLAYYGDIEELIEDMVRNRAAWRVLESRPTFPEVLFFSFLIEVNHHQPISNKAIHAWFKEMCADTRLYSLAQEPKDGYPDTELSKLD